ncbi:MAG: YceI family protein [Planctomyces sp.]|nr:YceI family protein [Planctomyces sp.]
MKSGVFLGLVFWLSSGFVLSQISSETVNDENSPRAEKSESGLQVNVETSRVYIFVGKTGLGHDHGIEGKLKSGHLDLAEGDQGAGEFVFDMSSFDADTAKARRYVGLGGTTDASTRQQVNTNMKADSILYVRKYPTATFKIDSCRQLSKESPKGNPLYELSGEFSLRGVSRTLKFEAEMAEQDGTKRLKGNFNLLQTNFGITPFKKAFGAVGVANQLRVYGDIVFEASK